MQERGKGNKKKFLKTPPTRLLPGRPDQDVHTRGVCLHVQLELVDRGPEQRFGQE